MSYWFDNAVVYHIYPLGYCGKLGNNEFVESKGEGLILRVIKHIPTIKKLGFNTVYIGPLFESTRHGYDTADYTKIDSRLGTNEDFALVCKAFREHGLKVILDGVFNHVGRDFWAFKDVRQNNLGSKYADWFFIRGGNSGYNDGFFYEGWEGYYDLVKLNLHNPDVRNHLFDAITSWVKEFDIDGLRLDVAYCLEPHFLKELRRHCKGLKPDFWLMGETLHGDYNTWMNPEMLDSVTNYECYKGLHSSFNDLNMFEIAHSLTRQFNGLYTGKKLYTFVDNHDVGRIASVLKKPEHLLGLHTLLFTMPGVPGIYYGSEYGIKGEKSQGDDALRPEFILDKYTPTELTEAIAKLAKAHATLKPLHSGDYRQVVLNNQYYAFARSCDGMTVYSLINASDNTASFYLNGSGSYADVLGGGVHNIGGEIKVPPYGAMVLFQGNIELETKPVTSAVPETALPVTQTAPVMPETVPVVTEKPKERAAEPKLLYKGKTKDVYDLENGEYLLKFKDDATGEDGKFDPGANHVIGEIKGKGKAGLHLSEFFFNKINEAGYPTHFVECDVEKAEMIVLPATLFGKGIEVVCRYKAAGSFTKRYGGYVTAGAELNGLVEVTLKDDERDDPPACRDTLAALGILTNDEFDRLTRLMKRISDMIKAELERKGLELIDLKLEFGRNENDEIMLIDEVSGDCMRVVKDGKSLEPLEFERIITG
jgi:phosphoribosylaminoimidazole-succinocarboxamide synthase